MVLLLAMLQISSSGLNAHCATLSGGENAKFPSGIAELPAWKGGLEGGEELLQLLKFFNETMREFGAEYFPQYLQNPQKPLSGLGHHFGKPLEDGEIILEAKSPGLKKSGI